MRCTAVTPKLLAAALAVFAVASGLFVAQGGFGAGHGRFDLALFVLGLPWVLIPWPEAAVLSDYLVFVLIPLGFNLLAAVVVGFVLTRRS